MNSGDARGAECELVSESLAELALGTLSGRSRSDVLGHLETCAHCRAEAERLTAVVDELLHLAPAMEPPLGFELRLAERLRELPVVQRRRSRRRRTTLVAAVALVIAGAGFAVGSLTTASKSVPGPAVSAGPRLASLVSHGAVVGAVQVAAGSPSWVFMSFDAGSWSGRVTCEVTLTDGSIKTIGVFDVRDGYGEWGAPLAAPAAKVRSARLVALDGSVLASARFRA